MTDGDSEREQRTAAERELLRLLALLKVTAEAPDERLRHDVMRTLRWQRPLRGVLRTFGDLTATIVEGLTLIFGLNGRRRER